LGESAAVALDVHIQVLTGFARAGGHRNQHIHGSDAWVRVGPDGKDIEED